MDWDAIFSMTLSPWEMIIRGTLMYWFLFLIFRWVMRRTVGSIALADLLLLVLIADAAQNAMAGDYKSFPEGAILIGTIVGWNMLVDWSSFRFAPLRRFFEPKPLPLVWHGRVLRKNMREEMLSHDELMGKLREKGIEDLADVKAAYIESDGEFSVLRQDRKDTAETGSKQRGVAK
jgi:uncharacterized membrane protein YcaP (DUF421 family)